jgi:hypothetical protein
VKTGDTGAGSRWKPLRLPLGLIAAGVLMSFIGPLTGLGWLIAIGGVLALGLLAVTIWLAG